MAAPPPPWPPPGPLAMVCVGLKAIRASKIANDVMQHLMRHTPSTCISRLLGRRTVFSRQCRAGRYRRKRKKPTWRNTLRYSTTSAYSLTSPPARPGCSLSSHPTTSNQLASRAAFRFSTAPLTAVIVRRGRGRQVDVIIARRFAKSVRHAPFSRNFSHRVFFSVPEASRGVRRRLA